MVWEWESLCCRAVPDERLSRSGSWSCRFQLVASQNWHDPLSGHPTWSAPEIPPTKSSAGLYTSVLTQKSLNPGCEIITCLLYLPLLSIHQNVVLCDISPVPGQRDIQLLLRGSSGTCIFIFGGITTLIQPLNNMIIIIKHYIPLSDVDRIATSASCRSSDSESKMVI